MADHSRLDDLRRRVQHDPASIAFAQLAEEYRRAGQLQDAVEVCRAGLGIHPAYLSARVTLGRALIELNRLDEAQTELEVVLKSAPENLAALRGLAEIHHRRGSLRDALTQYKAALALARNDPDLQQTVAELEQKIGAAAAAPAGALSFEQVRRELLGVAPAPTSALDEAADEPPVIAAAPVPDELIVVHAPAPTAPAAPAEVSSSSDDPARARATRTVAALEQWLEAIDVARAQRRP